MANTKKKHFFIVFPTNMIKLGIFSVGEERFN